MIWLLITPLFLFLYGQYCIPLKKVSVDGQPFISVNGLDNILEFWSVDNVGNEEVHNIVTNIKLDKTPPVADAGQDIIVNERAILTLNGSNSDDGESVQPDDTEPSLSSQRHN